MDIKKKIISKIREYDRIFVFRHERADGDCVGAAIAVRTVLRDTYPTKQVYYADPEDLGMYSFLGERDPDPSDSCYEGSLAIVVDTANEERISNKRYSLCRESIKIDHHPEREGSGYGTLSWVDPDRSSVSEMIAELFLENTEFTVGKDAAEALFVGIVTDSGRFRFDSVSPRTMEITAGLLKKGVDTEKVYSLIYLTDLNVLKFNSYVYDQMKVTENGVAYVRVTKEAMERFGLSYDEAAEAVKLLSCVKGALCWIMFIDDVKAEGSTDIRVRLRSRFMSVNGIAEMHDGGGHAHASGATAHSQQEADQILAEADEAVRKYKTTHEGWL